MFGLSVKQKTTEDITFPAGLGNIIDIYLLTPVGTEQLLSGKVALNGKQLDLVDDHTLPDLTPISQQVSQGVKLPPTTLGFWVFPKANARACL